MVFVPLHYQSISLSIHGYGAFQRPLFKTGWVYIHSHRVSRFTLMLSRHNRVKKECNCVKVFFTISWFFRMSSKVEFFQTRLTQHTLPHLRRSDFQLKALFGANMWYHTTPTSSTTLLLLLGANTSNHQQHYQAMAAKWSQCHFVHRRKGKERDWERFRERKRGK